jgi:hypothetical protein
MAAPWNPPVKGEDFETSIGLEDMSTAGRLRANPTIDAGDFQVSKDGGSFANLATLPTVTPASGRAVRVQLSSTEMNADKIVVVWSDQTAPPQWADGLMTILTVAAS